MNKINVSEATNNQLNWLVAKCEGFRPVYTNEWVTPRHPEDPKRVSVSICTTGRPFLTPYEPSSNWMQMGPIIEREKISVGHGRYSQPAGDMWDAVTRHNGLVCLEYGQTPLVAAARCYVVSKLGDVVEVPEELV